MQCVYYNIDKSDMRGQSYVNVPNMKGRYKGLQSKVKETSPRVEYPECCHEAIDFFALSQELYNFFLNLYIGMNLLN